MPIFTNNEILLQTQVLNEVKRPITLTMGTGSSEDDHLFICWNNFQVSIKSTFQELREEKEFMDVTLSCDGEQIKAHKVILSACSITFRNLLKKNPSQNPVIDLLVRISVNHILKNILIYYFIVQDVDPRDMNSILDFIYLGQVNIKQENLTSFIALAEKLRVRGLCQNNNSPEPAIKRSRPSLAKESQEDDIEEPPGQEMEEMEDNKSPNSISLLEDNFVPETQISEPESTFVADTQTQEATQTFV